MTDRKVVKKAMEDLEELYSKLRKMYPNDKILYGLVSEIVEAEIELESFCGG